ncbi:MAG TPA: hypothetical protein VHJ20_06920 [Polyangia bacterium]|nr:hypothetical protein [Polyangia bacterium]
MPTATGAGWRVEPSAGALADAVFGNAGALTQWAAGAQLGATARREGSPWGLRLRLDIEPVTDVGPGASLALASARLGVERAWGSHLVGAVDAGGAARRLSISDELTHTAIGIEASVELGWRFVVARRCVATVGVRYAETWFVSDFFFWKRAGALLSVALTR